MSISLIFFSDEWIFITNVKTNEITRTHSQLWFSPARIRCKEYKHFCWLRVVVCTLACCHGHHKDGYHLNIVHVATHLTDTQMTFDCHDSGIGVLIAAAV